MTIPKWRLWGMVALIALALVFSRATLTQYPINFIDEGWFSNSAWNWIVNGVPFDTMHTGPLDQYGFEWVRRNIVADGVWSLGFLVLGVGFEETRLISWIIGLGVLAATFGITRWFYGLTTALLAVLLLAISNPFLVSSHLARQDILLVLIGLLSFGIGAYALRCERGWAHVAAAFLAAFSINIHQNGVTYVLGYGVMYLVNYGPWLWKQRGAWLALLGGGIGVGIFLFLHILPNPDVYFRILGVNLERTHQIPILNPIDIPMSLARELLTTFDFDRNLPALIMIAGGASALLIRRHVLDRCLFAFTFGSWLGFVLLVGNKTSLYAIQLYPFLMIIAAAGSFYWLSQRGRPRIRVVVGVALAALILFDVFGATRNFVQHREYNYNAITEKLRTAIPPGSRVMGMPNWWFGFIGEDYRSTFTINFYNHLNGLTFDEALELIRPGYLIVDYTTRLLLVDDEDAAPIQFRAYLIPRTAFETMLAKRGLLVLAFDDPWHAEFKVYELRWE
ncbi:MAG: glycosyltransferase family 39 protein [Caldilinea sp.]